jgi:N6-L-threonylcarbamoyladenine synthase
MSILALETSCDDTCAAVIELDGRVRANAISSQGVHAPFGGVGLSTAKALAAGRELPFAAVDHLQGHVAANFIGDAFEPPFVCLLASGGHTLLARVDERDGFEVLGRTLDDAAGEAFDKGARMLGLGYPGGAALERLAAGGDAEAFSFPGSRAERARGGWGSARSAFADGLDFSFAGVKTALLYQLRELSASERSARAADLAASYQSAIVDSLLLRAERALDHTGLDRLAVGGGVAANGELRRRLSALDTTVHVPPAVFCTDNAAMIASAARYCERLAFPHYVSLDAYATGERPR